MCSVQEGMWIWKQAERKSPLAVLAPDIQSPVLPLW